MRLPEVEERRLRVDDGTQIAYHVHGEGPTVLLCNGLGGSWAAWANQMLYFHDRHRFAAWDYRGLYRSDPPRDGRALDIPGHAEDGLRVLDALGVERAVVMGTSMGVQVALEMFRARPDRVSGLVLVNGVAGTPWSTALNLGVLGELVPPVVRRVGSVPRIAESVIRRLARQPETLAWAKRVGFAASTFDADDWRELAEPIAAQDIGIMLRSIEHLGEHDAWGMLGEIDVPTLIIAGDRDVFTPRSAAERMARRIPGAELLVVPGGTHFVALEYPELINLRLEKFFSERAPSFAQDVAV